MLAHAHEVTTLVLLLAPVRLDAEERILGRAVARRAHEPKVRIVPGARALSAGYHPRALLVQLEKRGAAGYPPLLRERARTNRRLGGLLVIPIDRRRVILPIGRRPRRRRRRRRRRRGRRGGRGRGEGKRGRRGEAPARREPDATEAAGRAAHGRGGAYEDVLGAAARAPPLDRIEAADPVAVGVAHLVVDAAAALLECLE